MVDHSSTQGAEHWKQKYYDQLDQLEKKEADWESLELILKKAIGRLSLAAEGHNDSVDRYVRDIRGIVKKDINQPKLELVLDDLSKVLLKIEEKNIQPDQQLTQLLHDLLSRLNFPLSSDKAKNKLLKSLTKATDKDAKKILSDVASFIQPFLKQQHEQKTEKPGLLGRLLGKEGKPEPIAAEEETTLQHQDDLEAYRQCFLSLLKQLDNVQSPSGKLTAFRLSVRNAKERSELERLSADLAQLISKTQTADSSPVYDSSSPSIQELLLRLLEQLIVPADLQSDVEDMRHRLQQESSADDWKKLLKDVASLINSIRSRLQEEKTDFEEFLQQITSRLKEMDSFLQVENSELQIADQEGKAFDIKVASHVQTIRDDITQASELNALKETVENRLDTISEHIKQYRTVEQSRYQSAQKNINDMQQRMLELENETSNLKKVIVEKNKLALYDALTGIPNRLFYEQKAKEEIARRKRFSNPLSLAIWDVDFFKKVNDRYGHKAGDKVLKTVAQLLNKRIRETDFLARFGGEEFVMLLPGTKEEETLRLVNELREQVANCGFHFQGEAVPITISCGISSFKKEDDTLSSVFERADQALYKAKENGRNQCVVDSCLTD